MHNPDFTEGKIVGPLLRFVFPIMFALFLVLGILSAGIFLLFPDTFSAWMHAPAEAFAQTSSYIRICGGGAVFIVAYNVLGSVFRGLGNSRIQR